VPRAAPDFRGIGAAFAASREARSKGSNPLVYILRQMAEEASADYLQIVVPRQPEFAMFHDKPRSEREVTFVLLLGGASGEETWDEALGDLPAARMAFAGACLLRTSMTADELRDHLSRRAPHIGKIMVVQAGEEAAWTGLNPIDTDWLLERL
jgi:hypothetical protein